MSGLLRALLAVAVLATVGVPASASAAEGPPEPEVVGIRLVAHPDQAAAGRRGQVSVIGEVTAGSTVDRQVVVTNRTRSRQEIAVYVGAATIDGDRFVPADGEGAVEDWAATTPSSVTLEPSEAATVDVRIEVPSDAANGEHYAVVWAQPPAGEGDIRLVNRVGVRVYLAVSGGVDPVSELTDFVIDTMVADVLPDGRRQVRARVRNTGERALDLHGDLSLRDGPGGSMAGPFPTDEVVTLAVGGSGLVTVTLDADLPLGPWLARLVLHSGEITRAAEATIGFPASIAAPPDEAPATMTPVEQQRRVLIPLVSTMIVTLLVILLVLLLGRRRKKDDEDDQDHDDQAGGELGAAIERGAARSAELV